MNDKAQYAYTLDKNGRSEYGLMKQEPDGFYQIMPTERPDMRIKRIEYYPDGQIKAIEYYPIEFGNGFDEDSFQN